MIEQLDEIALQFLTSKNIGATTATPQQISDAQAYSSCYTWYLNKQQVLPNTADLAASIFVQKYALHDANGMCLEKTPEDMWCRLAKTLAEVEVKTNRKNKNYEYWYNEFYNNLSDWKAVPGGSALSVLGNPYINSSASNCFVVGTEDSLEGIMQTASDMARLQSYRGGTGIDISPLRPAKAPVHNSARFSTGAVSFMDFFSKVTSTIGQAGRCLREDQKVLTTSGLKQIKDVISGDLVWTQKGWVENKNTINNGQKQVYKLTTSRGLEIVATDNHIFSYVSNFSISEKQLMDFAVGDTITIIPGNPVSIPYVSLNTTISYDKGHGALNAGNRLNETITYPEKLTEDLAYLIGYSFGDGYVERDKWDNPQTISLACAEDHPKIQEKLILNSNALFNYNPKINKGDGRINNVKIHSKLIALFLESNGLLKQKHNKLVMPKKIKLSSTSVQMAFISGYFDADGYASGSKKGYVIASVCLPILKEMQKFLISAGIVSHINNGEIKSDTSQRLFSLFITGTLAQKRSLALLNESIKIKNKAFVSKRDTVLTPFNPKAYKIKYNNYAFIADNTQNLSTNGFIRLKEDGKITDELLVLDTVKSIEPLGMALVYDLQLASHHLFYCEGFNVHNSGATMISIDSHHPDIERFIEEKQDLDKKWFFDELAERGIDINDWKHTSIAAKLKSTTKANVSVKAYDAFMKAVEADGDYELYYEFKNNKYPRISKTVKATSIWNKLVAANVNSAEPGIIFWDTVLRESVSDCYAGKKMYDVVMDGQIVKYEHDITTTSTNPCSELPLPVGSACTLLSQNLTRYITNPWKSTAAFDYVAFKKDIRLSTRMLDNIKEYDINKLPLMVNKVDAILCRRIGLGCHGLADALAALGFKYDSDQALNTANKIYSVLADVVYDESVTLGQEKGNFPIWNWELEKENPFINRLDKKVLARIKQFGRRNIACLTNAPTGSISIESRNCSSGIEPVFKLEYMRSVKKQGSEETVQYVVRHQALQDCIEAGGDPSIFIEANNINWEYRVKMQATIQQHIDHSISSTVNLPEGTTKETVSKIYLAAWKAGIKGITIYVEGSRTGVLTSIKKSPELQHTVIERPKTTTIDIHKVKYKDKPWCVLVGRADNGPIEVFAGIEEDTPLPNKYHKAELTKKSRGHYSLTVYLSEDADSDVIKIGNIGARFPLPEGMVLTRFISLSLRNGVTVSEICEQLTKSSNSMFDYPAVLNRVLKNYISEAEYTAKLLKNKPCPDCGKELKVRRESGCMIEYCETCSYINSKCS